MKHPSQALRALFLALGLSIALVGRHAHAQSDPPLIVLERWEAKTVAASGTDVHQLVKEVAQDVQKHLPPGWTLDLSKVRVETPTKREMWDEHEGKAPRPKRRGLGWVADAARAVMNDHIVRPLMSSLFVAAYTPDTRALAIPQETLRVKDIREIKSTIAHELVHAAQHQNYPTEMERWSTARDPSSLPVRMMAPESPAEARALMEVFVASRILVEGQAMAIQGAYDAEQGARVFTKLSLGTKAAVLTMLAASKNMRSLAETYHVGTKLPHARLFGDAEMRRRVLLPMARRIIEGGTGAGAEHEAHRSLMRTTDQAKRRRAHTRRPRPHTPHTRAR